MVLTEELNTVKMELVNVKQNHANLHQQASDANAANARTNADTKAQISSLEDRIGTKGSTDRKPLIEPKQVEVWQFAGSMTDGREKFLEWSEKVFDRVDLYEDTLVKAMAEAEQKGGTIDATESAKLGVSALASKQLHGFLKDKTTGTAAAVIRGNDSGVGLESWRRLCAQFNPKTIRGTLQSQHNETHPEGAKNCRSTWVSRGMGAQSPPLHR